MTKKSKITITNVISNINVYVCSYLKIKIQSPVATHAFWTSVSHTLMSDLKTDNTQTVNTTLIDEIGEYDTCVILTDSTDVATDNWTGDPCMGQP